MIKKLLYFVAFIVLIQFIKPTKNTSKTASKNSIYTTHFTELATQKIINNSCNDCHSNHTNYLWYHDIAPISWVIASHVNNGKKHLNFDEWSSYNKYQKTSIYDHFRQTIKERKMPLSSYLIMHKETALTDTEREILLDWFVGVENEEKQIKK